MFNAYMISSSVLDTAIKAIAQVGVADEEERDDLIEMLCAYEQITGKAHPVDAMLPNIGVW